VVVGHLAVAVLALLQTAVVKLQEEAGLVHLVEEHPEPCGPVAVVVEVLLGPCGLVAVVAFVAAVAWQQIAVVRHLEEAVAVEVELQEPCVLAVAVEVEELLEPCELVVVVVEALQGQTFDLEEVAEQTVGQEEVQTAADQVVEVGS